VTWLPVRHPYVFGVLLGFLLIANCLRDNSAIKADSVLIYKEVQEKLSVSHSEDLVITGSLLGFLKTYELKYIPEIKAYEFNYTEPMICIEIKIQDRRKNGNIKIKKIIEQCESESSLIIK